jgi:hypothetical protein
VPSTELDIFCDPITTGMIRDAGFQVNKNALKEIVKKSPQRIMTGGR